ncbi:MAG: hypothetical protein WC438_02760 [Candidatus Pacearchaeota archaeon]
MKLQMIISKDRGKSKVTRDDVDNIEGCAYLSKEIEGSLDFSLNDGSECEGPFYIVVKGINTSAKTINQFKKDNGRNSLVEINSPDFRDVNTFYQEMFKLQKYGMNFSILDSRISDEDYTLLDWVWD